MWRPSPRWPRIVQRGAKRAVLGLGLLTLAWFVALWLLPPPDPYQERPAGTQIFARDGQLLRGFLSADQKWRLRVPLDAISPRLITATLIHEDRWFYRHPGIDPLAVARSAWTNLRAGRVLTGASTITMQLARLVEPGHRSLHFKLFQMFRALQYEWLYSKDEILQMYLNLAPYGRNIEGAGAAAYIYFDKPAAELSMAEACLLAILPQSPTQRDPLLKPDAARKARNRLLQRLHACGAIDAITASESAERAVPLQLFSMPFTAPHFCEWMRRQEPHAVSMITTLDMDLQARVQTLLEEWLAQQAAQGITQGAAVILDAERSELLAMVGSASYGDSLHAGQVNGAVARRSPGSTLKPFVYALAFDRGLATPATLLEDVPIRFGAYCPENYDGGYRGALAAAEALRTSRNVPAVMLASQLQGGGSFHRWLQEAGVASLDQGADHYGLSLVLGGADVTLLELAELYALLARQGIRRSTTTLLDRQPEAAESTVAPAEVRMLSAGAAYLTLQELVDVSRPELDRFWRSGTHQAPIPWKTGTSYGHRDAWSIGIAGPYVVAVWLGNFDGAGSPHLIGREVAAPLLFDLIALLPRDRPGAWHRRPPGLVPRRICAVSGAVAGEHCPATVQALLIPGVSPHQPCRLHRLIEIDTETGHTVCSRCRRADLTRQRVVAWWPPRVATYLAAGRADAGAIPPHDPDCPAFGDADAPIIVSPQEGMEFHLRPGVPLQDQRIALSASVSRGCRELFWFVDGLLVGKAAPGQTLFLEAKVGRHRITVKDDAGRSAATSISVVGSCS